MEYKSVLKKTDIGRDEIKYQSLGVLPREARTLLIMIDGKRTYQNYVDSLDDSKMFAEFGGVTPLFELLLELGCIEIMGQSTGVVPIKEPLSPIRDNQAEFDKTFNNQTSNDISNIGSSLKLSKAEDADYKTTKSELANFIEKNAPPEESWGHMLSLEQCDNASQLLELIQRIQNSSNTELSRGMESFFKRIKTQV